MRISDWGSVVCSSDRWGNWRVVDAADRFITKRVEVMPGHRLSLQFHFHRSEHWVIVAGSGEATVDDSLIQLKPGDYVTIPCGARHRIRSEEHTSELQSLMRTSYAVF